MLKTDVDHVLISKAATAAETVTRSLLKSIAFGVALSPYQETGGLLFPNLV